MEKTYDDNEIEIDLLELLGEFRRRIWSPLQWFISSQKKLH